VSGALVGARFAGFSAFEAMCVLIGVFRAMRLALATKLRAQLAKAGVLFRFAAQRSRRDSADVRAVEARERAFDHLGSGVADVFGRAFIAGCRAEQACLNGTLHILLGFFCHGYRVLFWAW
jgi:hypothetical protein